jgi:hypothetical protein
MSKGNRHWESWTRPSGSRKELQFKETVGFVKLIGRKEKHDEEYIN